MDNFMSFMIVMRVLELGASLITAFSLLAMALHEVRLVRKRKLR